MASFIVDYKMYGIVNTNERLRLRENCKTFNFICKNFYINQ